MTTNLGVVHVPDRVPKPFRGMVLLSEPTLTKAMCLELQAFRKWGAEAQAWMVVEEAGEGIVAVAHASRGRLDPAALMDEAADLVMVAAAAVALAGGSTVEWVEVIEAKMERLRRRLDGMGPPTGMDGGASGA